MSKWHPDALLAKTMCRCVVRCKVFSHNKNNKRRRKERGELVAQILTLITG